MEDQKPIPHTDVPAESTFQFGVIDRVDRQHFAVIQFQLRDGCRRQEFVGRAVLISLLIRTARCREREKGFTESTRAVPPDAVSTLASRSPRSSRRADLSQQVEAKVTEDERLNRF